MTKKEQIGQWIITNPVSNIKESYTLFQKQTLTQVSYGLFYFICKQAGVNSSKSKKTNVISNNAESNVKTKNLEPGQLVLVSSNNNKFKAEFVRKIENSNTKVIVKCIDRGKGYDEQKKKYIGVKSENGWFLGENRDFGQEFIVHVKSISLI